LAFSTYDYNLAIGFSEGELMKKILSYIYINMLH